MGRKAFSSKKRGTPYVPSYMRMDPTKGPELCVVCQDLATGFHYRCMTCEGCKGFFRRTTQKDLKYICKGRGNCIIDKNTRNQCPQCRYQTCIARGMAVDLVLNEHQRVAKRQLIEENRERRQNDAVRAKIIQDVLEDKMNIADKTFFVAVLNAYSRALSTSRTVTKSDYSLSPRSSTSSPVEVGIENGRQVADLMTPAITRLINFAQQIPGFRDLVPCDQISLLKTSCLEIMIFRSATRYDASSSAIVFNEEAGLQVDSAYLSSPPGKLDILMQLMFNFAVSLSRVALDPTEIATLVSLLLVNNRSMLSNSCQVEKLQDQMLGSLRRYECETYPEQPGRFARLTMKLLELRTVCRQNSDQILTMKLDGSSNVPIVLFETMFCH